MTHDEEEERLAATIAAARPGPGGADGEKPARRHGCDVLIADDAGPSREILSAILRNLGQLELREARNGPDALKRWRDHNPRITLLDIDMPGMDGLATLKLIRQEDADAFVAIVSGGSSIEQVKTALSLGAAGYVIKPFKPQRILDLLLKYRELTGHDLCR
jgi:two-component system chemotaxis response regulator CheY